jgi:hypothetical protein
MEHPSLALLRRKGALDFAIVNDLNNASTPQPIELLGSGKHLTGPVFVVANYLVDSIPTDIFMTSTGGAVSELREREDRPGKKVRRDAPTSKTEPIELWPFELDTSAYVEPWQKDILDFVLCRDCGIHLVPWGFGRIVSRLRHAVGPSFPLAIAVSDVPFAYDDPNGSEHDVNTENWTCPQISPSSDALALPVDFELLGEMFKKCGGGSECVFESTLCLLSSFGTVLLYDSPAALMSQTFKDSFSVLNSLSLEECRSLLTKSPEAAQRASLAEMCFLLRSFSCEFSLFSSLQWTIAKKVREGECDDTLEETVLGCLANCDARMSESKEGGSKCRREIVRFFYAINKHAILLYLHEFSGGGKASKNCERASKLTRDWRGGLVLERCAMALPPWSDALPEDAADELYILSKLCLSEKVESEKFLRRAIDVYPKHPSAARALRR